MQGALSTWVAFASHILLGTIIVKMNTGCSWMVGLKDVNMRV
jgi:hypothetical protein